MAQGVTEREHELRLSDAVTEALGVVAAISATIGAALYVAPGQTEAWFAWVVEDPRTAAALGAGYITAAVLIAVSVRSRRWADARLALVVTFAQLVAMAYATLLAAGPVSRLGEGGFGALVSLGWWVFHVVGPVALLVVIGVAMRGQEPIGRRSQSLPRWTFGLALTLPGVILAVCGVALLSGAELIAWPTSAVDAGALGAWVLAVGLITMGAVVEHDLRRLQGTVWAALVFGLLLVGSRVRFDGAALEGVLSEPNELGHVLFIGFLLLLGAGGLFLAFALPSDDTWARRVAAADGPRRGAAKVTPMADAGFFGPDSVAWRVWSYPTSLTVGFQRSVVVEELDPFLVASVDATQKIRTQPRVRYDHTIRYFATVTFADSQKAVKASEILMEVHAANTGIEPISGEPYDPNDPDSQLWILLTAWHSILYTYELYGPGRLSDQDETRYWQECAIAAELQTCDPEQVPRSRQQMREYFEQVRPQLVGSEVAAETMEYLLDAKSVLPTWLRRLWPVSWVVSRALRIAVVGTMPHWQRQMVGLRQSAVLDAAIVPVMRVTLGFASRWTRLQMFVLRMISPSAVEIAAPVLYGVPPESQEILTPAEAFDRHGVPTPAELNLRA